MGATLYVPAHFRVDERARVVAFVQRYRFATLVGTAEDGLPLATHLPLFLEPERGERGYLVGHLARANPHAAILRSGRPALAIFDGPHAYVSPRYHEAPETVPTWNYEVVHAWGTPRVLDDPERTWEIIASAARFEERGADAPWDPESLSPATRTRLMNALVAFEIPLNELTAKAKLSQNRTRGDIERTIAALERGDPTERACADAMRDELTRRADSV